ncbi:integral membrane protein [Mycobacteroides abscessus subsp. abscessus]|nr:integral membrane protein [Mycobacteroides abscessus subsp. abscessus]SIN14457.1 integral membrane protein [Mycobacteroides abscessus subsp. abscessus]SIN24553.1 integral membrane protein [Mycobacteroides abscessus subsp. abscessus]
MWLLMQSDSDTRGWLFFIVKVTAFSVGLATMFALIQQPVRRSFATALAGLNRVQRRQAATAISRGDIPRDPAVLSAAVRLATIALGVQRRAPSWAKWFQRISPILFLAFAVGDFINDKNRHALAYTVFAVLLLVSVLWSEHVRHRTQSRVDLLNSAASAAGAAPPHSAADYPALMSGRKQVLIAVAIGLTTAIFAAAVTYFADQPNGSAARSGDSFGHAA